MLYKFYLFALAVFVLVMGFLTYLAYDWLGSVTAPEDVVRKYEENLKYGRFFLLVSSLLLLIFANVIFWKMRQAWTFWATLAYFAFFILIQNILLNGAFVQYQNTKKILDGTFSWIPLIGVSLCISAAFVVFINQFVVTRMHDKMFAQDAEIKELTDETDSVKVDEAETRP